jgi:hypothetical protein
MLLLFSFVMFPADAPDRSCEEQQRMIDRMLYISRRMYSLLAPVLSPAGSFCAVIALLHDRSLCNLLGAANCSRLGHSLISVSLDTHDGEVHPHTTGSE